MRGNSVDGKGGRSVIKRHSSCPRREGGQRNGRQDGCSHGAPISMSVHGRDLFPFPSQPLFLFSLSSLSWYASASLSSLLSSLSSPKEHVQLYPDRVRAVVRCQESSIIKR
jgi:hypothetical protein